MALDCEWWSQAPPIAREALVYHELPHAGPALDKGGEPRFTQEGDPIWGIRGHDLEEFGATVKRYGAIFSDITRFLYAVWAGARSRTVTFAFTTNCKQDIEMNLLTIRNGVFALVAILALLTGFSSFFTVRQYERAIVTRFGAVSYIADPGAHFKTPFMDSTTFVSISQQSVTTKTLNTYTIDNQEVDAVLVIQYRLAVASLPYIYGNVGIDPSPLLVSMATDRWKIEAGKINVNDFADNRGALVKRVFDLVRGEAERLYRVDVTDVQLVNLDYQQSYRDAQAQAAVVKTQIEQAEGLKRKAVIDADRAKIDAAGRANQAIETARGASESVRLQAIAESEAIRLKGVAEAGAQQLLAAALTSNPALVELERVKRWSGILPVNVYAGAPIPFFTPGK